MTDKELRRLHREDLLQILINQQRQIDDMAAVIEDYEKQLADRHIAIEESGSMAEAALKLNGVFTAAQEAADQYLEETKQRVESARKETEETIEAARKQAEEILKQARQESERILAEAKREAEGIKAQSAVTSGAEEASRIGVDPEPEATQSRKGWFRRNKV